MSDVSPYIAREAKKLGMCSKADYPHAYRHFQRQQSPQMAKRAWEREESVGMGVLTGIIGIVGMIGLAVALAAFAHGGAL